MLSIASRYIGWSVCRMILIVTLIVAVIQFILGFVGDLSHIGHGTYTFSKSLLVVLLQIPMQVYALFSVLAFLGAVLSLGMMIQRNELVVFRASGLSLYRLLRIVLQSVFLLTLVVGIIGETLAPRLNAMAVSIKQTALYKPSELVNHYWQKSGEDIYFIREATAADDVKGLVSLSFPLKNKATSMTYAPVAQKWSDHWHAFKNQTTTINKGLIAISHKKDLIVPLHFRIASSQAARHAVDQESVVSLQREMKHRRSEGKSIARYQVAFWARALQPISTLVLVLLSVPIVFSQVRRSTGGSRLLVGLSIGFLFYLINQLIAPVGVLLGWSPIVIVALPISLFLLVGVLLLKRESGSVWSKRKKASK